MALGFLFDIVHHRGQITTYLRPMGSTVPQIYGPSGDEPLPATGPSTFLCVRRRTTKVRSPSAISLEV
jgi:hypothetical protein